MTETDLDAAFDLLVAASIAAEQGFTKTRIALQHMTRCALCPFSTRCNGLSCLVERDTEVLVQRHQSAKEANADPFAGPNAMRQLRVGSPPGIAAS